MFSRVRNPTEVGFQSPDYTKPFHQEHYTSYVTGSALSSFLVTVCFIVCVVYYFELLYGVKMAYG
jgi:hypothetical protein